MKKPQKPNKPEEPIKPPDTIAQSVVLKRFDNLGDLISSLPENFDLKNIEIEHQYVDYYDRCSHGDDFVKLSYIDYVDNTWGKTDFDRKMRQYEKEMKVYETKMKVYESEMIPYIKEAQKEEVIRLKKRLAELENK